MGTKPYISPIQSIFILDITGMPLFARYYNNTIDKEDSTLLAGFLSAIEIFTTSSLDGKITDLGMTDRRYFFDRSMDGAMMVASTRSAEELFIDPIRAKTMKILLRNIGLAFDYLMAIAKENHQDILGLSKNFGESVDSLILEAALEFIDLDLTSETSYLPVKL